MINLDSIIALAKVADSKILNGTKRKSDKLYEEPKKKKSKSLDIESNKAIAPDHDNSNLKDVYPYETNDDDHCESPLEAYKHISMILELISQRIHKSKEDLVIYDPFFCEGSVVNHLHTLGFHSVYNRKEDFYKMQELDKIPYYDVLLTNPPYSEDHMQRLLEFCVSSEKPWLLLLPNYVYTKDYYSQTLSTHEIQKSTFFLCPFKRYLYTTPKGRRQSKSNKYTAPFPTFWYCNLPQPQSMTSTSTRDGDIVPTKELASEIIISRTSAKLPLAMLPEADERKKRERNSKKRQKNKQRKTKVQS